MSLSKLIIFILFGSFLFQSCKKEEEKAEDLKFPIDLKFKTYSRGKMRMWTKSGEVLEQQKIKDFVGTTFTGLFDGSFYKLQFTTKDSAKVAYPYVFDGVWTTKVLDTAHILFTGDVHLFESMVFGNQATLDRSFLIYTSNTLTRGIRIIPQPGKMPSERYQADLGFIANGNRKKLSIPGYLCKMRLYKRAASVNAHFYGEFKESFLDELQDRDTLVIQTTINNWSL